MPLPPRLLTLHRLWLHMYLHVLHMHLPPLPLLLCPCCPCCLTPRKRKTKTARCRSPCTATDDCGCGYAAMLGLHTMHKNMGWCVLAPSQKNVPKLHDQCTCRSCMMIVSEALHIRFLNLLRVHTPTSRVPEEAPYRAPLYVMPQSHSSILDAVSSIMRRTLALPPRDATTTMWSNKYADLKTEVGEDASKSRCIIVL